MSEKILITGASSEIGIAIAKLFDNKENTMVLHCHSNENRLKENTRSFKAEVKIYSVDFNNAEMVNKFLLELNNISILINAAAYTKTDILVNLSDEDILKMMYINNFIPVKLCRTIIPQMIVKRNGIIINLSSISALRGNRGSSVYGGTKNFLESFTRSIAAEYGMKGIRANCVAPGAIDAGSIKELLQLAPEELKKSIASNHLGKPEDVASLVYFLCSKDATFINGQTIHVDGGFQKGV